MCRFGGSHDIRFRLRVKFILNRQVLYGPVLYLTNTCSVGFIDKTCIYEYMDRNDLLNLRSFFTRFAKRMKGKTKNNMLKIKAK